ncbi:hypothetical protein GDO81_029404, partial [Engystomops pustulosus]
SHTMDYSSTITRLRRSFRDGKTRPLQFRISQLEALGKFLEENKIQILESLKKDLNKPSFEAELSELSLVKSEINLALNNLGSWMKDEHVSRNMVSLSPFPSRGHYNAQCVGVLKACTLVTGEETMVYVLVTCVSGG